MFSVFRQLPVQGVLYSDCHLFLVPPAQALNYTVCSPFQTDIGTHLVLSLRTFTSVQCPMYRQPHVHLPPYTYAQCSHSYTELSIQTVFSAQCSPVQTTICRGAPCSVISTQCSLFRQLRSNTQLYILCTVLCPVHAAICKNTMFRVQTVLYKYCASCSERHMYEYRASF